MKFKAIFAFFISLILAVSTVFGQNAESNYGWHPSPKETERFAQSLPKVYADQVGELIVGDDDADALLYRALIPCLEKHGLQHWIKIRNGQKVVRAYNQNPVGSCVGNATAADLSVLNAVEVIVKREPQEFIAMHSADGTYGLCREAGGYLKSRYDGCSGSAAAKSILEYGTLYQLHYGNVDLTQNIPSRAREFGYGGVGSALLAEAAKHKAYTTTRVKSAKEAWPLIGNGYPINVCSNVGFSKTRNTEGVCRPSGSWNHSMAVVARRTTDRGQKLFLIWNSWGDNWAGGPYWEDMPEGSFWVEWDVMDRMLQQGDSFAYGNLDGFKPRSIDDLGSKEYLGILIKENDHAVQKDLRVGGGIAYRGGSAVWQSAGNRGAESRPKHVAYDDRAYQRLLAWLRSGSGSDPFGLDRFRPENRH